MNCLVLCLLFVAAGVYADGPKVTEKVWICHPPHLLLLFLNLISRYNCSNIMYKHTYKCQNLNI